MKNTLIKPRKLQPGDKVAAVTLSWGGPGAFPQRYQAGKRQLEEAFGVQVVEMAHTLSEPDWLDFNPQARADDLMQAFSDTSIQAVISSIGGDDSIRILPYLDLNVIKANPKIFMGYSDTTITHMACWKAGLSSFYGPSIMAGFAENGGLFPYMVDSVRRTLFSAESIGVLPVNTDGWTVERLDWSEPGNQDIKRKLQLCEGWHFLQGQGTHGGHLIGGCLEVLDWLRGTDFWPEKQAWENAVIFIETSEEAPSPTAVKRILRAFAAAGVFEHAAGLLVGRPGGEIPAEQFADYDTAVLEILVNEQGLTNLPIITNMDFGHTDPMMVLPYGAEVVIDCEGETIAITENAVTE